MLTAHRNVMRRQRAALVERRALARRGRAQAARRAQGELLQLERRPPPEQQARVAESPRAQRGLQQEVRAQGEQRRVMVRAALSPEAAAQARQAELA